MPLIDAPVITLRRLTVICDRCGRKKAIELTPDDPGKEEDLIPSIGWDMVRRPDPTDPTECENLYFDTRSCMSAWFATFVRVRYGGPAELPPRQRSPRKAASPNQPD